MSVNDFVRVRAENGAHVTIPRITAEAAGLKPLKQPAFGRDGRPAPIKPRLPLGGTGSGSKTPSEANPASESKED